MSLPAATQGVVEHSEVSCTARLSRRRCTIPKQLANYTSWVGVGDGNSQKLDVVCALRPSVSCTKTLPTIWSGQTVVTCSSSKFESPPFILSAGARAENATRLCDFAAPHNASVSPSVVVSLL